MHIVSYVQKIIYFFIICRRNVITFLIKRLKRDVFTEVFLKNLLVFLSIPYPALSICAHHRYAVTSHLDQRAHNYLENTSCKY